MRIYQFLSLLLPTLLSFALLAAEKHQALASGERIHVPSSGSIWIENRRVLRAEETPRGFYLIGVRPGQSQVRLGQESFIVSVLSPSQNLTYKNFSEHLKKSLGLKLQIEKGKVVVKGRLLRLQDWISLSQICREIQCDYLVSAKANSELKKKMERHIFEELKARGLPAQRILFGDSIVAHVNPGEFATQITQLLSHYGIQVISQKSAVEVLPLVRVQITVAEVKKEELLTYGVSWPGSYTAQVLPKFAAASQPVEATLNLMEKNGWGKILASPNLLCRSGKEAEFIAGGEFPIKMMSYKMQDVVWKKYGILLKVKPVADFSGRMSISIETEVSSIDTSRTVDGVPGLFTNRVQSHFDLTESRIIALSGLIKSEQGQSSQGLPGLGRIPILGPLFASKDFRENRTELVIFVKPEIVNLSEGV